MAPRAVFVRAEETLAVGLEARGRSAGREEILGDAALHVRALHQNSMALAVADRAALHRLGHPVGVGKLLQGIEVGVFHDRHEVELELMVGRIVNPDIADLAIAFPRYEDPDVEVDAVEASDKAGVTQADPTFPCFPRIEARYVKRRKDPPRLAGPLPLGRAKAGIEGLAFEIARRHLADVLYYSVEGWIALAKDSASGRIYESAEIEGPEVINPFHRCPRCRDDILFGGIIEMAVVHWGSVNWLVDCVKQLQDGDMALRFL